MTGSRIKQAAPYINNETFMLTYGDGVADIDINKLIACHKANKKLVTMTAVQPMGRFGALDIKDDGTISSFQEKPKGDGAWVNGGFFVCEPKALDYISDAPDAIWEQAPLKNLAKDGNLNSYKHHGFWRPMDTLKDKIDLNEMWNKNQAPWKIWEDK